MYTIIFLLLIAVTAVWALSKHSRGTASLLFFSFLPGFPPKHFSHRYLKFIIYPFFPIYFFSLCFQIYIRITRIYHNDRESTLNSLYSDKQFLCYQRGGFTIFIRVYTKKKRKNKIESIFVDFIAPSSLPPPTRKMYHVLLRFVRLFFNFIFFIPHFLYELFKNSLVVTSTIQNRCSKHFF